MKSEMYLYRFKCGLGYTGTHGFGGMLEGRQHVPGGWRLQQGSQQGLQLGLQPGARRGGQHKLYNLIPLFLTNPLNLLMVLIINYLSMKFFSVYF